MGEPGFVVVHETVDFQGLIDQPTLGGMYPTGRWCLVKKEGLQLILNDLDTKQQITETTHSIQVSQPVFELLMRMA